MKSKRQHTNGGDYLHELPQPQHKGGLGPAWCGTRYWGQPAPGVRGDAPRSQPTPRLRHPCAATGMSAGLGGADF